MFGYKVTARTCALALAAGDTFEMKFFPNNASFNVDNYISIWKVILLAAFWCKNKISMIFGYGSMAQVSARALALALAAGDTF